MLFTCLGVVLLVVSMIVGMRAIAVLNTTVSPESATLLIDKPHIQEASQLLNEQTIID